MILRQKSLVVFSSVLFILVSCNALLEDSDEDDCELKPTDCISSKPGTGDLIVSTTINSKNPKVPLTIFRGDFEKNDVVLRDTLTGSGKTYILPSEQYYSVVAEYIQQDGDTVIAIDGDDVEYDENSYCDGVCYELDPGRIDVKLHFPKENVKTRYMVKFRKP